MRSPKWWVSLAAGALLASCFPPYDVPWPFAVLAIALWFVMTGGAPLRTVVWRTFAFGMGFYLLLLRWMMVVGWDAWILLAALQTLYLLLVAYVRHRFDGRNWELFAVAVAWSAQDWLRDHAPLTAFGWGQLAFASVQAPWAMFAPWGGQSVVTAVVALSGVALGRIFVGSFPRRLVGFGGLLLALTVPLLLPQPEPAPPALGRIALVQAGVDHTGLGFLGDRRSVLYRHRDLTITALTNNGVDAVVWPENASDADPFHDALAAEAIHRAADATGRPLLLGAVIDQAAGRANVTLRATPGSQQLEIVYRKQRLVPFGEFLPFRDFLTRVTERVQFLPRDFVAGNDRGSIDIRNQTLGIVICFEVADEQLVRTALGDDASALVVQTNNATYAGTGQSEQQLRISQFRARAFGVPVYVVSTNGPTAIVDATGAVVRRVAEGEHGVLIAPLVQRRTAVA